tara:strand:- start:577 stop:699 length:123 start_codon:yes stop_codon:yes gene_type:complete
MRDKLKRNQYKKIKKKKIGTGKLSSIQELDDYLKESKKRN